MKIKYQIRNIILGMSSLLCLGCQSRLEQQRLYVSSVIFPDTASLEEKCRMAAHVIPSERQLAWQEMEFTCFICYGINTFTDREWGTGKENPHLFYPTQLDARQWVRVAKDAGMKMILLTCKHHDGFCLWPSKYTDFSVASSPWRGGKGDLVREVSEACQEAGLKFAVYLSPWDMNHPDYGTEAYNDYFVNQLEELLTQYGPISEVWFDGACGEGPNGKKQEYDFERYYRTIRRLQPDAVIAVMGPDVRWVGTESGYGRDTEWSVIPASQKNLERIAASSQREIGTGTFVPDGDAMEKDLGSRKKIKDAQGVIWYPSEVDVSIRPGWYYHESQDTLVKTPQKLIDIYYSSIGKNSLLLLNLPPDKRGLIHENDMQALQEMQRILRETFRYNLLVNSSLQEEKEFLTDSDLKTYWKPSTEEAILSVSFMEEQEFNRFMIQENITEGQRVENFRLEYKQNGNWQLVSEGTTIGYKRILRFPKVKAKEVRLVIQRSRDIPQIAEVGLYLASKEEL